MKNMMIKRIYWFLNVIMVVGCLSVNAQYKTQKQVDPAILFEQRIKNGVVNDRPLIVELTRKKIKYLLSHFCSDPKSRNYGGFVFSDDPKYFADCRNSIYNGQFLFVAYLYADFPEFFKRPEMFEKLLAHLHFMQRRQMTDGSIMLDGRGVGGSNEVGFTLPALVEVYKRLIKSDVPGKEQLMEGVRAYILNGAKCIRNNFPYTSNHRWTASIGPLAMVNSVFPDPLNIVHIEDYLSDGIDINEDGAYYEERSPNYNNVANWGLIYLIDYYGQDKLKEIITRNLNFVLDMVQPNGEAETIFSHRQDRGQAGKDWKDYYLFKRMALETGNGQFATVADQALREMAQNPSGLDHTFIPLLFLFDNKKLSQDTITRKSLRDYVEKKYEEIPIWRFRNGNVATTIVADNGGHWWDITQGSWGGKVRSDAVMSYHAGNAVMDIFKIKWGLGNTSFRPARIEYLEDGRMKLDYVDPGWEHVAHFRPKEKWGPRLVATDIHATVWVSPQINGQLDVEVQIIGYEEQPINVQYFLRANGDLLFPDGVKQKLEKSAVSFVDKAGDYIVKLGNDAFEIVGLPESEHHVQFGEERNITGNAEKNSHKLVVGLFTPVHFSFTLKPVLNNSGSAKIPKKSLQN